MVAAVLTGLSGAQAQVDPIRRELVQLGYNLPLEGTGPLAAYAFYYLNKPFTRVHTNLTLRLAVAPVYLDSELGVCGVLGSKTDLGVGLAGGGFADSYNEVRGGRYRRGESFEGHGGELGLSVYHCFNPNDLIPLFAVVRGAIHGTMFNPDDRTDSTFRLPDDQVMFRVRSGLRWGGREPLMMPEMAMELSVWYEGTFRTRPGRYGYGGDRAIEPASHLLWGRALMAYTVPDVGHRVCLTMTGGGSVAVDRYSAYRLGGNLPLNAEFPLSLPGYYFQELSARAFALMGFNYGIPLDRRHRWHANVQGMAACVNYARGLEQPREWNRGVGGGLSYRSPSGAWEVAAAYGYGFDALRSHGYGAQSVTLLLQFDLGRTRQRFQDPSVNLNQSRGLQSILRNIFR
ncbi:MAG: hypothetical protein JXQ71_13075 [Verrucomicrobia bacterium]|nr:hypothetical protein [Verrucomicrobiota bacterium]